MMVLVFKFTDNTFLIIILQYTDDGSCISQQEYTIDSLDNLIEQVTTSLFTSSIMEHNNKFKFWLEHVWVWYPTPIDLAEGLSNHRKITIVKDNNGNISVLNLMV